MSKKEVTETANSDRDAETENNTVDPRSEARRRLILAIGGTTGLTSTALISNWKKPQVESVLLPAHAQTTPTEEDDDSDSSGPAPCSTELVIDGRFNY